MADARRSLRWWGIPSSNDNCDLKPVNSLDYLQEDFSFSSSMASSTSSSFLADMKQMHAEIMRGIQQLLMEEDFAPVENHFGKMNVTAALVKGVSDASDHRGEVNTGYSDSGDGVTEKGFQEPSLAVVPSNTDIFNFVPLNTVLAFSSTNCGESYDQLDEEDATEKKMVVNKDERKLEDQSHKAYQAQAPLTVIGGRHGSEEQLAHLNPAQEVKENNVKLPFVAKILESFNEGEGHNDHAKVKFQSLLAADIHLESDQSQTSGWEKPKEISTEVPQQGEVYLKEHHFATVTQTLSKKMEIPNYKVGVLHKHRDRVTVHVFWPQNKDRVAKLPVLCRDISSNAGLTITGSTNKNLHLKFFGIVKGKEMDLSVSKDEKSGFHLRAAGKLALKSFDEDFYGLVFFFYLTFGLRWLL